MTTTDKPDNFDPSIAVSGVIVRALDDILLLRRAPYKKFGANQWALCAGKSDNGEDAITTAKRELFEELDLDLPLESFIKRRNVLSYP